MYHGGGDVIKSITLPTTNSTSIPDVSFTLTKETAIWIDYMYGSAGTGMSNVPDRVVTVIKPDIKADVTYLPADYSDVKVQRLGKNLSDLGTFEINRSKNFDLPYVLPAGTYTVSGILDTTYPNDYALIQFQYTDDTWYNQCGFNIAGEGRKHAYAYLSKPVKRLSIHAGPGYAASAGHTATYTDFMIERGSTATDYEPYIEPVECTANADGTVEGVKSLYPNMTLIPDTDGVVISTEYIKDIDKAFEAVTTAVALTGGE